jgi:hypothetical protein
MLWVELATRISCFRSSSAVNFLYHAQTMNQEDMSCQTCLLEYKSTDVVANAYLRLGFQLAQFGELSLMLATQFSQVGFNCR